MQDEIPKTEYDDNFELPDEVLRLIKTIPDVPEPKKDSADEIKEPSAETSHGIIVDDNKIESADIESAAESEDKSEGNSDSLFEYVNSTFIKTVPVIDQISELMNLPCDPKKFENRATEFIVDKYNKILKSKPIEYLNRDKAGIRVSAMRNAGIRTLADLGNNPEIKIRNIRGIGNNSIILTVGTLKSIKSEIFDSIHLEKFATNPNDQILVEKEYYLLRNSIIHGNLAKKKFGEIYKRLIICKNNIECAKNKFAWSISPIKHKKGQLAAKEINDTLTEDLINEINALQNLNTRVLNASDKEIHKDCIKYFGIYFQEFENVKPKIKSKVTGIGTVTNPNQTIKSDHINNSYIYDKQVINNKRNNEKAFQGSRKHYKGYISFILFFFITFLLLIAINSCNKHNTKPLTLPSAKITSGPEIKDTIPPTKIPISHNYEIISLGDLYWYYKNDKYAYNSRYTGNRYCIEGEVKNINIEKLSDNNYQVKVSMNSGPTFGYLDLTLYLEEVSDDIYTYSKMSFIGTPSETWGIWEDCVIIDQI